MYQRPPIVFFFCILLFACYNSVGQDPQYSQFYQAPIYLNPGFTGLTDAGRAGINYRIQGEGINSKYVTSSLFADYNFSDFNLGAGILLVNDKEEFNGFQCNTLSIPVSYTIQINKTFAIKPAVAGSHTTKSVDLSSLLFGDQLDPSGNFIGGSQETLINGMKISHFNIDFGVVSYTDRVWFGLSVHHLLNQNNSFIEGGNVPGYRRYSIQGGFKLGRVVVHSRANDLKHQLMPSFNYIHQGEFDQLDAGLFGLIDPITYGLIYRGIPLWGVDQQAVSALVGFKKYNFNVGYSFDFVLHKEVRTGGIHELSLSMTFDLRSPSNPPRNVKRLKCPVSIFN